VSESFFTKWERVIKGQSLGGVRRKTDTKPAAWSSGRDESFGGRFFCFHGLRDEEYEALRALAERGLGVDVSTPPGSGK
jgi:hypothetical protein